MLVFIESVQFSFTFSVVIIVLTRVINKIYNALVSMYEKSELLNIDIDN